eukprot:11668056-Alexandrium_andersonii.AAC.1
MAAAPARKCCGCAHDGIPTGPAAPPPGPFAVPPMGLSAALMRCGVARRCPLAVALAVAGAGRRCPLQWRPRHHK